VVGDRVVFFSQQTTFDHPLFPQPQTDPLRKFYTSMLAQIPGSALAQKWCVQHGLLDDDAASKWVMANGHGRGRAAASPAKRRPSAPGAARKPAPKPVKKAAPGKKKKASSSSDESSWDDSSSDSDVPLAKRAKPAVKKKPVMVKKKAASPSSSDSDSDVPLARVAAKPKPPPPAVKPKPEPPSSTKKRDVAFADGGLDDSSSDDDVPLAQRVAAG
jgi:hypothetical protein